jgi:hypothetical protein
MMITRMSSSKSFVLQVLILHYNDPIIRYTLSTGSWDQLPIHAMVDDTAASSFKNLVQLDKTFLLGSSTNFFIFDPFASTFNDTGIAAVADSADGRYIGRYMALDSLPAYCQETSNVG